VQRQAGTGNPILADSYAAGVYGSIVVTALVTALREQHASPGAGALSIGGTVAVFWLVHVWAQITGERIYEGATFSRTHTVEIARAEWPLVEAGVGPTAVLLVGWAGALSHRSALTAALAVCGVQLATWGFLVGRRAYHRWDYAVLSGLANFLLGVGLVALETSVLH
jgi:hypothetical protein